MQVFFVRELAARISLSGENGVIVNCMTPGACHSQIHRSFTGWKKLSMWIVKMLIARSAEAGSRTLIAGIVALEDSHGQYMADCQIARYARPIFRR
jgi:retinol dehydrogenase-12